MLGERGARAGRGGERADGQPAVRIGRMPEQQPQDLAAGVAAGTGNRHRSHARDSAWLCSAMQIHSRCSRRASTKCRDLLAEVRAHSSVWAPGWSGALSSRRRARRPRPPRRRGRRWPRPRSACGPARGSAAPASATCGARRSAGRCRRRTAPRPPAARRRRRAPRRPRPGRPHRAATTRLTSWNTAGNGDTRGAGSVSAIGTASRSSSTAQVPFGSAGALDHGGMQLAGVADDAVRRPRPPRTGPDATAGTARRATSRRPRRRGRSPAPPRTRRRPRPGGRAPTGRAAPAGRSAPRRRAPAGAAATRPARRSRRRSAGDASGSARRPWSARSAAPPARWRTARHRRSHGRRCGTTLPAAPAAAWWPGAAGRPPAG